ncbi:hypothetical protein AB1Y20_016615 [Prymnesium parvum]|uniref:Phosphodiesterase n=1 Tax=Prymnesium parvum TaxID=97485 RepID=A0AB34IE99_PRYPA
MASDKPLSSGGKKKKSLLYRTRRKVRHVLETLTFEVVVIVLVLVYALIIFLDLVLDQAPSSSNSTLVDDDDGLAAWNSSMRTLDFIFLSIFVLELLFRLFGEGLEFLYEKINAIDAVVVIASLVVVALQDTCRGCRVLQLLRIIRLFRFAVIIGKLQRARDAAALRRKRVMYRRMGAPVEKVLEFLTDFHARLDNKKDQDNVRWMMEVIAADDLYSVRGIDEDALRHVQGLNAPFSTMTDISRWLSSETGVNTRQEEGKGESGEDEDSFKHKRATGAEKKFSSNTINTMDQSRPSRRSSENLWVVDALESGLNSRLQVLHTGSAWEFDIFAFDELCQSLPGRGNSKSATILCFHLLEHHGFPGMFGIKRQKLLNWLTLVEEGYIVTNSYHNALHAADVTANINYFLKHIQKHLSYLEMLSCLIAAIIHDLGHTGVNNSFLEASRDALAITYNDVSILENHHLALAFSLLDAEDCDWTSALSNEQYKDFRETVIAMVLGTDMRSHFDLLNKFKSKVAGDVFAKELEKKDSRLLLTIALHAADICNPAKPRPIALEWCLRSMEEFFHQGDIEMEKDLPISPFMDRRKPNLPSVVANCQIGFINVLVKPFLQEWAAFLGEAVEADIMRHLAAAIQLWETQGTETAQMLIDFLGNHVGNHNIARIAAQTPTPVLGDKEDIKRTVKTPSDLQRI